MTDYLKKLLYENLTDQALAEVLVLNQIEESRSGYPGTETDARIRERAAWTYVLRQIKMGETPQAIISLNWAIENAPDSSYKNNLIEQYAAITGDFDTYTPKYDLQYYKNAWNKRKEKYGMATNEGNNSRR